MGINTHPAHIMFGAAYYLEYEPTPQLEEDMRLMQEAHMNVIRVGESVWSRWEPQEGVFNLDWLEPVLDAAHTHNIDVIIGLPTYAIPMWLARRYPEVALQSSNGVARGFGAREEHNYNHPTFRFFAERVCHNIVKYYRDHPAVIGWQLHNEPGIHENTSPSAFEGFKDWLRNRYNTVDKLNKAWGLVYWSHELSTWDDLWQPESNAQPQYDIEWRRYQAWLTEDMLTWQRDLIDGLRRDGQFITVNHAMGRFATNEAHASCLLDVAGADPYLQMQDGLTLPEARVPESTWAPAGAFVPSLLGDRMYSLKQAPYYVLETNGGPIDGPNANFPGYHGQWKQVGWQFISRGAEMIEYWHWRQLHYGTEMYWGGVLPHDGKPGRVYRELAELGSQLEQAGSLVTGLHPDYDVTMLYSVESRWALEYQSHLPSPAGGPRYVSAFDDTFTSFYRGAFLSGRQVRIIQDEQIVDPKTHVVLQQATEFASSHPLLVVAGIYLCTDTLLQWLREYVQAGGHLILGPRSAYADELACARTVTQPANLWDLAQASYQEFSNIGVPVAAQGTDAGLPLLTEAATEWIDCLRSEGAHVLATSDHPHFAQFPLVTSAQAGKGRMTVVATLPNTQFATALFDDLVPMNQWASAIHDCPTVTHSSAVNAEGRRIHWFFNWSWDAAKVQLPSTLLTLDRQPRTIIELEAWDVIMLMEDESAQAHQ